MTSKRRPRPLKGLTMSDARLLASARAESTKQHKKSARCPVCAGPKLGRLIACSRPCIDRYNSENWAPKKATK